MEPKARARALGNLIDEVFKDTGLDAWMALRRVREAWVAAAGSRIASHTRVLSLKSAVLRVEVDSAPLQAELSGFRKAELLKRLAEELPAKRILDLKFTPGSWGAPATGGVASASKGARPGRK